MNSPTETYCLLQETLGAEIPISALEEAADATQAMSRLDCLGIHRNMCGVVIAGLSHGDALAFQGVLAAHGHPTRLCADDDFPLLHESFQVQRLDRQADTLVLTSSTGRVIERHLNDLVFLAAGFYQRVAVIQTFDRRIEWSAVGEPRVVEKRQYGEKQETDFRMDLFFARDPHRLNLGLTKDSAVFFHGRPFRLRDRPGLTDVMREVAAWLPQERVNLQLRDPARSMVYQGLHGYESEIRWHFQRFSSMA